MSVGPLERALNGAVRAAEVQPRHRAAVASARRLAQLLDAARADLADPYAAEAERAAWDKLGQRYLAALAAAGLTVERGQQSPVGAVPSSAKSTLEALRSQAAGRRTA